jgi:tetratricopeptide (TPR) repeat protein
MKKLNRNRVSIYGLIYPALLSILLLLNIKYVYAEGDRSISVSREAESYRVQGYEAQQKGDIDTAIEWYQKAAALSPSYAAPHNDLGILFETKGWLDRAEAEYRKALTIDPNYKEVHTNLALLYERKGELEKAAFHWMKRYKLGNPDEPWTQEAKARLQKLGLLEKAEKEIPKAEATPIVKQKEAPQKKIARKEIPKKEAPKKEAAEKKPRPEKEVAVKRPAEKKAKPKKETTAAKSRPAEKKPKPIVEKKQKPPVVKKPAKTYKPKKSMEQELEESLRLAEKRLKEERNKKAQSSPKPESKAVSDTGAGVFYNKAMDHYNKGEYSKALDSLRTAKQSFPENKSLLELENTVKNKMKEERIQDHYSEGMIHYRQKDYTGARKEFEAILSILPE